MIDLQDFDQITKHVHQRLAKNERVRQDLPGEGRIRIDRQLPFLCVYHRPDHPDQGTQNLVTSEAAYLYASGEPKFQQGLAKLCRELSAMMQEYFGVFLFIEIWAELLPPTGPDDFADSCPAFTIVGSDLASVPTLIETFQRALSKITIRGEAAKVFVREVENAESTFWSPVTEACSSQRSGGCLCIGLSVRPIYRDEETGQPFPMILQSLRSQLAKAIRKTVAEFLGSGSTSKRKRVHYQSLGPTSFAKAARLVDQQLCEVSQSFDFLLQTTPINAEEAWDEFEATQFTAQPAFRYPPLPFHVSQIKRRLFNIEIEQIEDPTLSLLFYEKQNEIDRTLTALRYLEKPDFLHCSLQLHGEVDDSLLSLAETILKLPMSGDNGTCEPEVQIDELLLAVRKELDYYHRLLPEFHATVEVCDQLASGLMVSQHRLLLARTLRLPKHRVDPLMHHEVGTHLLTYFNGRCQPLCQLYAGLAGYEELQEGLAVLAEYLTGGLTLDRLRTLAGRVIAAHLMTQRVDFADTFLRLRDQYQFPPRQSFSTTLRVYRGGGSTKDIIYLRGLRDLLEYLSNGHDLEPLYVGKLGLQHVPHLQELRRRGIVKAPSLLPRFWKQPGLQERLDECRTRSVVQLLEPHK